MTNPSILAVNLSQIIEMKILKGHHYYIKGTYSEDALTIAQAILDGKKVHSIWQNS